MIRGFVALLVASLAFLSPALGSYTPSIVSFTIESGQYVIASDATRAEAGYDRDRIALRASVSFSGSGFATYRCDYQMLDPDGNLVLLSNGAGGTTTTVQGTTLNISSPVGMIVNDHITPAETLASGKLYRVRLLLKKPSPVIYMTEVQADTAPRRLIHFASTTSNDAAVNLRAYIQTIQWVKSFACATDPANLGFTASATLQLFRYDAYLSATPTTQIIPHRITYELVEAETGTVVAISGGTTGPGYNMDQHAVSGGIKVPFTRTVTRQFNVQPNLQLDPVNKTYLIRATLSHEEVPGSPHVVDDGPRDGKPLRLLHYSGIVRGEIDPDELIITSITNNPGAEPITPLPGAAAPTHLLTVVTVGSSHISGSPGHSVNWGTAEHFLFLYPDGSARYLSTTALTVTPPAGPDIGVSAGVRFRRDAMTFNNEGLRGNVTVFLPAGLGAYAGNPTAPSNHVLESVLDAGPRRFNQSLLPEAAVVSIPTPNPAQEIWHIREESKPVEITTLNILWNVSTGQFAPGLPAPATDRARYVRKFETELLSAAPIPEKDKELLSNELFYRHVGATPAAATVWSTDADGVAEMQTTLVITPGAFTSHFPRGAQLAWAAEGTLRIEGDLVVPSTSSLPQAEIITLNYARDCGDSCGTIGDATVKLNPAAGAFGFTRDGGLNLAGTYLLAGSRRDLVMGYIDALSSPVPVYAHDTSPFLNGRFLMAGHHLSADDFTQSTDNGPGVLLNTGFDPTDGDNPERPGNASYLTGLGDYPGMNYRVSAEAAAPTAVSVLGGQTTPVYTLGPRSKYYTRSGGVSGIHEPAANPFTGPVFIYGYEFTFNSFGLSFLDSGVHDSITAGSVTIPYPSDFVLAFDPLFFDCLGGLTTANIPGGSFDDDLAFWNAGFTGLSAHFQPAAGADCDPSQANLVVGVRTFASNIASPLAGSLGFHPDGNLITAADGRLAGIDSRLNLPSVLEVAGLNGEHYNFFPTHGAYYENHEHSSSAVGRLSFPGLLDVPFFEDLEVHFQTAANEGNTTDVIHMMGGWPGDGVVTAADFDTDNRSYPASSTLDAYRAGTNPAHRVHAVQNWLGVVNFDYELNWDTTTRSFRAAAPVTNDFLVLTTKHTLVYLSAKNAELDFGANLDLGFPEINLSNITINLTDNTGVRAAIDSAITQNLTNALVSGLDSAAELLNDRMDVFYDRVFEQRIDPLIDNLYAQLAAVPSGIDATNNRITLVKDHLSDGTGTVFNALEAMDGAVGQAGSIIDEVDRALARLQIAIRSVIGRVEVSGGQVVLTTGEITVPEQAVVTAGGVLLEGIFADHSGTGYDLAKLLTAALIEELAPDIAGSLSSVLSNVAGSLANKLGDKLDARFQEAAPTIDQIKEILLELHNTIQQVRDAGGFYNEISAVLLATNAVLKDAVKAAEDDIAVFLRTVSFQEYTAAEIKQIIRTAIRDRFNASPAIASIQATLKAYVYDLDAAINQAISSAFAEVNRIITRVLADALPADASLTGLLGDVSGISAAGSIDGYAHINGDALRKLRLDADFQLKLPADFEFSGYIEINQLNSDGDGSCSFAGEGQYAAEVKLGATNVPVSWSGDGLRFDVETKFTFDTATGFALRGFGGALEMTQGKIGFESMAVTALGAAAMFGKDENFLAAQVGLQFDSYQLLGGIFFGRTCSVDPLKLVDPDVAKILGSPPFTGIYAYGEAQIPIVNAGCFFRLTAKAGAGVFWFEEGNTYGGKMVVGATGRALCAVGVGGDLTLIGAKSGNNYSFFGRGRVWGEVGVCKLCTTFSEQVELTFKNGKWSYNF